MPAPGVARLSRLLAIGVARISFGSALQRAAIGDLEGRLATIAAGADDWAS
jgi:hypothetical protein